VLGVAVDEQGAALCPFHDDTHPSFHVFEDTSGVERWACYPCSLRGDVYDLVRIIEGCSFPMALERIEQLRVDGIPPPPAHERAHPLDRDACATLVDLSRARARTPNCAGWMCVFAGLATTEATDAYRLAADAHLREHWRWGVGSGGELVFPHYDTFGSLTGCKFRAVDGTKWSFPGSQFHALYGSWRQRVSRTVVLCEGETDAAWASLQHPAADVLALPSGAGRMLEAWTTLEADTYWLAFDADEMGRAADARWRAALAGDVRTIPLPDGHDLKSWRADVAAVVRA
jgi:hypothetical protein